MIHGERIRLRAVERDDLPRFVDWFNDPDVRRGLSLYRPLSQAEEQRWYEQMLERPPAERTYAIDVREGDEWIHIGSCGFFDVDRRSQHAEMGIVIGNKAYWDKGFGADVMRTLLRHGFETLNLHRIYLRVFETNPRAIHLYEKIGFRHEGRLRQHHYLEGHYVDELMMAILRDEWSAAT
jgi:RimJ/RimL family protein N-acetyltransferase